LKQEIPPPYRNIKLGYHLRALKNVKKNRLINALNYINFEDGSIFLSFRHLKYDNIITVKAKPQPCAGKTLFCSWDDPSVSIERLKSYKFEYFNRNDGQKLLLVDTEPESITREGVTFELPDICYEFNSRISNRFLCDDIRVIITQNGLVCSGKLFEFNAQTLSVNISESSLQSFQWLNPMHSVNVLLNREDESIIYSGNCNIVKQRFDRHQRIIVLEPIANQMRSFNPKEFRSRRQKIFPSPNVVFSHPFTNKMVNLEIDDISGSGFSVTELYDNSVLLTGMIIPSLFIEYGNALKINCSAQVVYRETAADNVVKCGLAIKDMDMLDHSTLSALLHQLTNKKSYICNRVDLDSLFKFFFDTGFVYPQKYASIQANKEKFKGTYEKLYLKSPGIARHFICQERGVIQAHMAMIRFYESTWLIHHHAAINLTGNRAGLVVLEQIGRYVNEAHRLHSAHMNYLICYFRPNNKFPLRVFGGVTKGINDPKGSSMDSFAYFRYKTSFSNMALPDRWTLGKARQEDLLELESHYEHQSGGLCLTALDLEANNPDFDGLNNEYEKLGFKRGKHLFALKHNGYLKAFFMATVSDIGLNMSELTNCIHVFILDDELEKDRLLEAFQIMSTYYEGGTTPVLLHPVSYAKKVSLTYEKIYELWVLNLQYLDSYFKFTNKLFERRSTERKMNNITFNC